MKGIILAGGMGTRLYPMTKSVSKQMIPIYDKPMIYYPLSVLMLAGIRDVLIISSPKDLTLFQDLLGDGSQIGMNFSYIVQREPKGLADAFILGDTFIGNQRVCLVLGDNIFYGQNLSDILNSASNADIATVFGYYVKNPKEYGVVEFNSNHEVISIEEKPLYPKSNYAVPGLYFYNSDVVEIAKNIKPSKRGELEITDVNLWYLRKKQLMVKILGRGIAWLDTGSPDGLLDASNFVASIQKRQGMYISCIEEIAYVRGFINKEQLLKIASNIKTEYGEYLNTVSKR